MENPYWLALADPELGYLTRIAAFTALFAGLSKAVEWVVASARPEGGVSSALAALSDPSMEGKARSGAQAASTVLSMVHALGTSAASIWTVGVFNIPAPVVSDMHADAVVVVIVVNCLCAPGACSACLAPV
ncbi:unnamed protein product [Polarella glacialis]|uniref:Uncharacterized protein n=1 Tax=Polarella glacialis TaxID=89957 RepID=A0A813KXC3_POLGL|nr:unnamed protein product [Polarella glacialis]